MKKLFLISLLVCVGILQSLAFDYTDKRGVTWCCSEIGPRLSESLLPPVMVMMWLYRKRFTTERRSIL